MLSTPHSVLLTSESINGVPLPLGASDSETTITLPPRFLDPVMAGTGAVIAQSTQTFGTITLSAQIGSVRHKALQNLFLSATTPGYGGASYAASAPARGSTITGRLFPMQPGEESRSHTVQEVQFTCALLDIQEVYSASAGAL